MVEFKEYDQPTLKRLQRAELSILRDFAELCKKNGLSFFISGGTAIGALRHGGFVPWDDDIDVCLPRKDYDRLIEVLESDPAMMEIQNCQSGSHAEFSVDEHTAVPKRNQI